MKRWPLVLAGGALCVAALFLLRSGTAPAATFATDASGFNKQLIADSQGRVLHLGSPVRRLAADRWMAVDFDAQSSLWFDDSGRVLHEGPYVEIRSDEFARHPQDPEQGPLFTTWSKRGMALLNADGSPFIDWQPGYGDWSITQHPQRYSWQPRDGGERIFDERGTLRLALDEYDLRAAGPFATQALYLICRYDSEQPCEGRDEDGRVRWAAQVDDLLELQGGRWLARNGNAWFLLDGQGKQVDEHVFAAGQYFPRSRSHASAREVEWPRWMTRYRLGADGNDVVEDSAVRGFLQQDGQFDPVPEATHAHQLCPGTWRLSGSAPGSWLADEHGKRFADHPDRGWNALAQHPQRHMAYTADERDAIVDCRGTRLFDDPAVVDLEPMGNGFAGQLAGEQDRRLWLDAELQRQLLPEGNSIRAANAEGSLLLVVQGAGMRLYNTQRAAFVGKPFTHAEEPLAHGLVFNRDGYYGLMDAEGVERLEARHTGITPWGDDRLWSQRYLDEGSELGLHRLDGSLIARWADAFANPLRTWQGAVDTQAVAQLNGKTYHTEQGAYFPQQWVDRDGRTLMTAVQCPGDDLESVLADGAARLETGDGKVLEEGGSCEIPEQIRAAIAAQPGEPQ